MAKKKSKRVADDADSAAESDGSFAFEGAMERIERIVQSLESGKLDLGDALKQYESAVGELKRCHRFLESAERQVRVLAGVDEDGNPITETLEDVDSDDLQVKQAGRSRRRGGGRPGAAKESDDDDDFPGLF